MSRLVWCRYCAHPATVIAGVFPAKCGKCDGVGFWATDPDSPLIERRKHKKRPRLPFALTQQDYQLLLKRLKIARE